jgi:hypothetical protein
MQAAVDRSDRLRGITRPSWGSHPLKNPGAHCPLYFQNRVQAEVVGPDEQGNLVTKQRIDHTGNIMVTYGLNRLIEMLASDAGGASAWANVGAIGTDSTAANSTNTGLGNSTQLASGASFARSDAGDRTWQGNMTFASNGQAAAIHEVGVFQTNQATASMIARSVLGTASINRGASDEIRVSYQIVATTG